MDAFPDRFCQLVILLLVFGVLTGPRAAVQTTFTVEELAQYRLSLPVFKRFDRASRLIATATRDDPAFVSNPLFTREVSVLGDAAAMATELEARLKKAPALAAALRGSNITAREYTTFALALFAARLAHGFVESGALRVVPAGVATDNVAFIEAHRTDITAILQVMGVG